MRSTIAVRMGWGVAKLSRKAPEPPSPQAGPSMTVTWARSVIRAPGEPGRSIAAQSSQARYVPSGGR